MTRSERCCFADLFALFFSQVKGEFNLCEDQVKTSLINDKFPLKSGYSLALGGWGNLVPETVGKINPQFLQYTIQEFITLKECNTTVTALLQKDPNEEKHFPTEYLTEGYLCTIPPKDMVESGCKGDSGSGLIMAPVSFLIFLLTLKDISVGS